MNDSVKYGVITAAEENPDGDAVIDGIRHRLVYVQPPPQRTFSDRELRINALAYAVEIQKVTFDREGTAGERLEQAKALADDVWTWLTQDDES